TESTASDTFCMSYDSIVNNTANGSYGCFYLRNLGSSHCIDACNIINNDQTATDYGTFIVEASLLVKDSCILGNNKENKVFYAISSKTITISNCTIDDDIFTSSRYFGNVTVNKTIERTFNISLSHIATQGCDSYFEITKSQYSYNNKSVFMYFEFIFLITMIPSDPANDHYFDTNCIFASDYCE
ncbi:MAG TPA: hypothetical protein PLS84_12045, partial [Salinivirgaceae bacterium]|nr:hypothetical protein [Salinivirgaceae bacterium]